MTDRRDTTRRRALAESAGRVKRLHVSQPNIRHNIRAEPDDRRPPIIVQTSAGPVYGWTVEVDGPSTLVWGARPLRCGARVWLETQAPVRVDDRPGEATDGSEAAHHARVLGDMLEALDGHLEAEQARALLAGIEALEESAPLWCPAE